MAFKRIVELSYPIIPGQAGRKFDVEKIDADAVAPVPRLPGQWYIMHNVVMVNHLGTHIEVPYHLRKDGLDLTQFPVENTIGTTRLLDVGHPPPGHGLTLEEIKKAAILAGGVQQGEIVFVRTGWDKAWGTDEYLKSPWVRPDALTWLVRQGMVMFGIDAAGVEELSNTQHESHYALFDHNVALIENLRNLDALGKRKTFMSVCTPIAVKGLEAFPIRVLGILNYGQFQI
ncbi:MAG: cyclase family protein [Phycisphaerae bacterium]|nr:cyclase family protein [Phycisphaerae bacterium]